jgi:hypothetical protein
LKKKKGKKGIVLLIFFLKKLNRRTDWTGRFTDFFTVHIRFERFFPARLLPGFAA